MLKRILVLLDETPSSMVARQYAFHLAQETNAHITGLAGVDLAYIDAPMVGGLGTTAYKVKLEERLKAQAEATRQHMHDIYERECEAHCIPFEWLSFTGDPIESLYLASEKCDLIITGHDTAFHGTAHEPRSILLGQVLLTTPRPVVVCPDSATQAQDVLIAYDGSVPAMRALQLFVLLDSGRGKRIVVSSIDKSEELATRRTVGAISYIRSHGYEAEACPLTSSAHPADALRIEVADRNIGTLVMGAYGHRGFRERLFGSTTGTLVENPPCPLFIYH
jgi:nucleotide-binding universal stress UspA family protein